MSKNITKYYCEQYNVNDDFYNVVEKNFNNGDIYDIDDIAFTLETSKANFDIEINKKGYLYSLIGEGDEIKVGDIFYIISQSVITATELNDIFKSKEKKHKLDEAKIITEKAKEIIREKKINISNIDIEVINEQNIKNYYNDVKDKVIQNSPNFNKIIKIGFIGSGHGMIQCLDIVSRTKNMTATVAYDDDREKIGKKIYGIMVKGEIDFNQIYIDYNKNIFDFIVISISTSIKLRKKFFQSLIKNNVATINLIDPNVNFGFDIKIGTGNIILGRTDVGACTEIGNNNFISTHCNIEHHNFLGNHCTFGPGVLTSGSVKIMDECKFGTGIFIEPKVLISSKCTISSGTIINSNVSGNTTVINNIATKHKEKK